MKTLKIVLTCAAFGLVTVVFLPFVVAYLLADLFGDGFAYGGNSDDYEGGSGYCT